MIRYIYNIVGVEIVMSTLFGSLYVTIYCLLDLYNNDNIISCPSTSFQMAGSV